MKIVAALCLPCVAATSPLLAQSPSPTPTPIEIMILGTYHFGNPGLDLHNMKAENVLTPEKQQELDDVAARLAKFKPTRIAIEALSDRPDYSSEKYTEFTPEKLLTNPDEWVQIAYRLAHRLGQKTVYGIDEQSDTIDYFPFNKVQAYAKAHHQTAALERMGEKVEKRLQAEEAAQKTTPIRLMLAQMNDPARIRADHDEFYNGMLVFGDEEEQPGADLNAAWYLRNAKTFAKLTQIARPGDRVLVVFGAGHAFWLRHFAEHTPGFRLVEPNEFLR